MTSDKLERYMRLAEFVAANFSKDPLKQVGAVVLGDTHNRVALGYNGFPSWLPDDAELLEDRDFKLAHMVHAEINALRNAQFTPRVLLVTKPPCVHCAETIVNEFPTVQVVVTRPERDGSSWAISQESARNLLKASRVLYQTQPKSAE